MKIMTSEAKAQLLAKNLLKMFQPWAVSFHSN